MRFFTPLAIAVLAAVVAWPTWATAQVRPSGLISPRDLRRTGLTRQWQTHIELDRARGRVEHLKQHVSSTEAHVIYEAPYDGGVAEFSARTLDAFGEPWGPEGALQKAEEFAAKLNPPNSENSENKIQPQERIIPEITIYAVTDRAAIHAIDGETGRTRWAATVGRRDFPTSNVAASDDFVAVLNGSTLYLLNSHDGGLVWSRRVGGAPGAGPAITNHRVFVPLVSGIMESYPVEYSAHRPFVFQSHGRALVQPVVSPTMVDGMRLSVAWPTDKGHLYVANGEAPGVRYRLETLANIVAPAAFLPPPKPQAPGYLFACSLDGYVYALNELIGNEIWRFSTGEPITKSPVPIDNHVYVITDDFGMHCLEAQTGKELWWTFGIKEFVAATADRVYVKGQSDELLILDRRSGARLGGIEIDNLDLRLANTMTDRLFLGNSRGIIQCLHEPQYDKPLLHVNLVQEEEEPAEAPPKEQPGQKPATAPPAGVDPFGGGGGADPFGGGGADPFGGGGAGAGGANPFGGGANPFGGGAGTQGSDAGGANPFGGAGDDPFGGTNPFGSP